MPENKGVLGGFGYHGITLQVSNYCDTLRE